MIAEGSSVGAPCTCERKPSSAYFSARVMPDFASCKLASTSWVLFPIDEAMPIPEMTTRLMLASPCRYALVQFFRSSRCRALLEQADLQILRAIDNLAVHGKPPVGDAEHELCTHHSFDVDVVHNLANVRQHLTGKFELAEPERPAAAFAADPPQVETDHLPQGVKAETAGHHGIVLEMAAEEPEVRLDVELGAHQALAVFPAGLGNLADAVEHQHRRQRQLRVARAEHLAAAAGQQILVFVTATPIQHQNQPFSKSRWSVFRAKWTHFVPEPRQFSWIDATTPDQDAPAATGAHLFRQVVKRVRGTSIIGPRRRQSAPCG